MARRIVIERLAISVALALGLLLIVFGFSAGETDQNEATLPEGVEQVTPQIGSRVQRQSEILADLAPGFDGELVINGRPVPPDQFSFDTGLSQVIFPCRLVDSESLSDVGGAPSGVTGAGGGTTIPGQAVVRPPQPECIRAQEGAELFEVETGPVTVTVVYWSIQQGRAESQRSFSWSFTTF